jgi:secretion/DNA translocation related TadE-like protein
VRARREVRSGGGAGTGAAAACRETGSATVLTVAAIGVVAMMLGAALAVVSVVHDVHRARAAADLSALAAAAPTVRGGAVDCAAAREVAARNDAVLHSCRAQPDGSVETRVARPLSMAGGWFGLLARPSARARAGLVFEAGR